MNDAMIDSIEWHKDQLFKLLGDDDLLKYEGDVRSVNLDLNEIIEKAKSKKKVWVKPSSKKKGHYREMEVGREEKKGKSLPAKGSKEEPTKGSKGEPDMSAYFDDLETHIELLQETADTTRNRDYEQDLNERIEELKGCLAKGHKFIYNDTGEGDDWMYLDTYTPKEAKSQYEEWNEE